QAGVLQQQSFHLLAQQTIHGLVPGPVGYLLMLSVVLLALAAARRVRASLDLVFSCGILGSLLATPFLHVQDLLLWLAVWWWMSGAMGRLRWLFGLPMYASALSYVGVFSPAHTPGMLDLAAA